MASASVHTTGSNVTVDCTTVTDLEPVVYTALHALGYAVIVTTWPAAAPETVEASKNATMPGRTILSSCFLVVDLYDPTLYAGDAAER